MEQGKPQRKGRRWRFNLWWALGISVLLHVVLALLTTWVPIVRSSTDLTVPQESVLHFTFDRSAELADKDSAPRGDVPFETPPPRPSVDPTPPPPEPGSEATPPQDASAAMQNALQPAEEPRKSEQSTVAPEPDDAGGPEQAAGVDLPEQPDATLSRNPSPSGTHGQTAPRKLDLDRAMRDFGRQLDQAREAQPPTPPGQGTPRNVFVPDPAEMTTTGYGLGNLTFETADFDWSDYGRAIYIQIWRAWHNRLLRLVNDFEKWSYVNREPILDHWNQIEFVIERSGEVSGILIETPSGCVPLDDSATQALEEVLLPPLPEKFPKDREVVHARFLANGEIRFMRPVLTRMKALNYF